MQSEELFLRYSDTGAKDKGLEAFLILDIHLYVCLQNRHMVYKNWK